MRARRVLDVAGRLLVAIIALIVMAKATASVGSGPFGSGLALSRRGPSAASGPVLLSFALPHPTAVRLDICDVSGRCVRVLVNDLEAGGVHDVVWDLRDDRGRLLPAGICFARLDVDGQEPSAKLVSVR